MSYSDHVPTDVREQGRKMAQAALLAARERQHAMDRQRAAAAVDDAQHPVDWILEHFRIPETPDRRLQLGPYQEYVLRRALTRTADGQWPYATVLWSDIKKSIKSTIAAAVALYVAWHTEWGEIYVVANDLKQADSRVGHYIRRAIELNRDKFSSVKISGRQIRFPNGTYIEAIPIDPTGEAGSNADLIIFSELHGSHHEHQKRMWTEMTLSPTKYGKSMRWVETYAGYIGESELLEQLYDQGTRNAVAITEAPTAHHWGADALRLWENPPARMLCLWNQNPRLPWQTEAYYREEAAMLLPHEFRRVHRNEWVTSADEFVPLEWFDRCGDRSGDPLGDTSEKTRIILGVDASITGDTTALAGVTLDGEGTDTVRHVRQVIARSWQPSKAQPMDYDATLLPALREAFDRWDVLQVAYDNYQLHHFMTQLKRENNVWVRDFKQGQDRLVADKQLRDLIKQGRYHWYPDSQRALREHVFNANAKSEGPDGDRLRIVKKSASMPVDLTVATSMAAHEALRLNM